uniref:Solute carrier family 22 member 5-like n=1 Tax=Saccoglossus kowalevskii TaxID=10224 RepID=A0ABM0MSH5_SACKO|nr:PREDICTED: solute carrier family 22 member 5-like [Saccoglossus kowalevskii]
MLHYDDVLEDFVGEFGTYQIICYIVLGMTAIPTGLIIILPVFMYAWTNSWCKVPHMADISQQFCIDNFTSNCEELVMNLTIPRERIDGECGVTWAFSQCFRYNVTPSDWLTYAVEEPDINSLINNTAIVPCDNGWDYDTSEYRSTVSQQFDLVCDRYYLNALASSIFMSGQLIGCLVDGYIIDKLGRMKGLIITISGSLVFGIAQAFAPNYIIFSVLSFVLSACIYGVYLSGFVLACEYVGPSKRTTTGMIYPMFYSIGYMLLALLAYFVREWWILQLIIVCPCILFLSYYWFIPESPRWLISMGRTQEAERIIKQCAKVNGRSLPVDLFNDSWIKDSKEDISDQHKHGILDLFRYSNMRKTTLILIYCWVTLNLAYYGISYDTSNLGGNPYLNLFIAGAVEIPAYGLGIFAMESSVLGRRGSIMITFLFGGVSCICLAWLPPCKFTIHMGNGVKTMPVICLAFI